MSLQDVSGQIVEFARPLLELIGQSPMVRWALAGAVWLFLVHRLFGRGAGRPRGLAHLYDLMVVIVGALLVWSFQFG